MIKLGDKVECIVTGFVGIAIARVEYLNGCIRYCIMPRANEKDGKLNDSEYIDEGQLRLQVSNAVQTKSGDTGGDMGKLDPPRR